MLSAGAGGALRVQRQQCRCQQRGPEHFEAEPLPPKGPVFDVEEEKLDGVTGALTVADRLPDPDA